MDSPFAYHRLNDVGAHLCDHITKDFTDLLKRLEKICPPGRELLIVKTKLEEACMFAKKAVAIHPGYQAEPESVPETTQ